MDEHDTTLQTLEEADAVLRSRTAGGRVIRGGALRAIAYGVGALLSTLASAVLLRYLGVVDVGRFVTVMSIVAIANGVTEGGLAVISQREYATARSEAGRRAVLADTLAMRLVLSPAGVLAAVAFALVAGYDETIVRGTAIAGLGTVLAAIGLQMAQPMAVELRLGALAFIEGVRQGVIAVAMVVFAALSLSLTSFFWTGAIAGVVTIGVVLWLGGPPARTPPRFVVREWATLAREALPIAIGLAINVFYVRILVVLSSILTTDVETGYFATSYRVLEAIVMLPLVLVGSAFPLLAHAGEADEERMAYAVRRIGEVMLFTAMVLVLVLAFAAEPILRLLGGDGYDGAVPVLQIQSFALLGTFMAQAWVFALIAVRAQRALTVTNTLALVTVLILGFALIPADGATGAAIAAVVGETALAVVTLIMLLRARPALVPDWSLLGRLLLCFALAGGSALVLPAPDAARAMLAVIVLVLSALALRAIPLELWHAARGALRTGRT